MGLLPLAPLSARELDQIPIIVERLKERVDPAAVTAEISELWTSAAIMAGLRFPWELIKHCFGGITAMRESSTIQAFIEEGRRKGLEEGKAGEARRIILLQGPMRFGAADEEVKTRLDEIQDLGQLEDMIKRILIASSWDELFAQN
jgi:predicted transposase YdaD